MKHLIITFLLLQYTLSVDVDLALFNVTVLDDDGHAVSGLTAENFRVFEGDNELPIKVFEPEDSPATVGLVIDNSGNLDDLNARADEVLEAVKKW